MNNYAAIFKCASALQSEPLLEVFHNNNLGLVNPLGCVAAVVSLPTEMICCEHKVRPQSRDTSKIGTENSAPFFFNFI